MYLNAIGGAAQYYARTVEKVLGVNLIEFGIPEAMWHLRVQEFRGHRHHGRARQQPARGRGEGDGREAGGIAERVGRKRSGGKTAAWSCVPSMFGSLKVKVLYPT